MLLNEFFGKSVSYDNDNKRIAESSFQREMFDYLIHQDDLHKKYVLPIAKKILVKKVEKEDPELWKDFVNAGCAKYYKEKKLTKDPAEMFSKKFREELSQECAKHFHKDIVKGEYKVGQNASK